MEFKFTFLLKKVCSFLLLLFCLNVVNGQFVKTEGQRILDEKGNELRLRGVGLGGWMLQEGYMLRTWGAQHELEARIEELIGHDQKEEFYAQWLANHCTRKDIDSLAAWGFNSVRLPMHYKLFTPPIEQEPIEGQVTWIDEGFVLVDSLLSWLKANEMYLILDLHAAPGGQGENADISDYDPSKPSLWESEQNQDKMVALWGKLAERYADEPTIAGYDLINETNWGFDDNHQTDLNGCNQSNNAPLWELQQRCTEAIRASDQNHMIIIEGNCWGNNYNGLPSELWDDNLTISYHKYWNSNDQSSLDPLLETRDRWNVPLWLGETGENSNEWFADAIGLLEDNNIGWSWWPQKKMGGNNVQEIKITQGYQDILDYWSGNAERPSPEDAYTALMQIAENLKSDNNVFHYDVVDAMMRQPFDKTSLPFRNHLIAAQGLSTIYSTDYDLGGQEVGYFDEDYTNETGQPGGAGWNLGGRYRNDGVDIEACEDEMSNGFNVGWTQPYEWMQYTVNVEETGGYDVAIRHAGISEGAIKIYVNEEDMSGKIALERTGGYQTWETLTYKDMILEKGQQKIKVYIEKEGANLNYLQFEKKQSFDSVAFSVVSAITSQTGKEVYVNVNKCLDSTTLSKEGFELVIDGVSVEDFTLSLAAESQKTMVVDHGLQIPYQSDIQVTYQGGTIKDENGAALAPIEGMIVDNGLPIHYRIPGRVYADDFFAMDGMVLLKNEKDPGSDYHLGYTDIGDYADYYITVPEAGSYYVQARAANNFGSDGRVQFEQLDFDGNVLNSVEVKLPPTGGWENWSTSPASIWQLVSGRSILRMRVAKSGINLTWFLMHRNFQVLNSEEGTSELQIHPNPATQDLFINLTNESLEKINLWDTSGTLHFTKTYENVSNNEIKINLREIPRGLFILEVISEQSVRFKKVLIQD